MKIYVSDLEESFKRTIIGHLGNSGTEYLLLHIEQGWRKCAVDEEKPAIPMVLYCSGMVYKYYSYLGFLPIKHSESGKYIHIEIFNKIPHFTKNRLHIDCLQYCFVMYKNKIIICRIEVINIITDSMIHVDLCKNL